MILLVELAQRMTRRLAVNFSMVRRRADWASRERRSASLIMTTRGTQRVSRDWEEERGVQLTLEPLLGVQVDLLGLSYVLEHLLHDRAIPVAGITVCGRSAMGSTSVQSIRQSHLGVSSMW